jgi:hypothetical protein
MNGKEIAEYIEKNNKKYKNEYGQFVIGNSALFVNIANAELSKALTFKIKEDMQDIMYSEQQIDNSFHLANQFFNIHKIKINLKELYDKKILEFFYDDNTRKNEFVSSNFGPTSYQEYTKEKGHSIKIVISNNLLDAFGIVHEVTHYMNQPEGPRNMVSDMLTEAISYGMEFIFAQSLINGNYKAEEAKLFIGNCILEMISYAKTMSPIYRIIYTYNKFGEINEKNYHKIIHNFDYESDVSEFEKYIQANRDYIRDTWDFLGRGISLYIYDKYKTDHESIDKLLKMNDAINVMSLDYCLKIIDINNPDELLCNIVNSFEKDWNYIMNVFE